MIAKQGQCFFDLVIQGTGNIENAFAMALLNGMSMTEDLVIGQKVLPSAVTTKSVVALYGPKNYPATYEALPDSGELSPILGGIGYMIIEETFIVS